MHQVTYVLFSTSIKISQAKVLDMSCSLAVGKRLDESPTIIQRAGICVGSLMHAWPGHPIIFASPTISL